MGKNFQVEHFEKMIPYGDTDVTLQFKTHDQNLQVCLKWETKIMLKQLFSHQNKEKRLKRLKTKEALTISIYKCLWFLEKQKAGHLSSYAQVNFPE